LDRGRGERERVRPGLRLAHAVCADDRPVAQSREVPPSLVLVAEAEERVLARPQVSVQREHQPVVGTAVAECLHGQDQGQGVGLRAAVLLRHGKSVQAEVGAPLPCIPVERARRLTFVESVPEIALREAHDDIAICELLVGPAEVHQRDVLPANDMTQSCTVATVRS
jgi:hypothetical protein